MKKEEEQKLFMEEPERKQKFYRPTISVPVSGDIYKQVRIKAAKEDKTIAAYVRSLVEDALKIQKI